MEFELHHFLPQVCHTSWPPVRYSASKYLTCSHNSKATLLAVCPSVNGALTHSVVHTKTRDSPQFLPSSQPFTFSPSARSPKPSPNWSPCPAPPSPLQVQRRHLSHGSCRGPLRVSRFPPSPSPSAHSPKSTVILGKSKLENVTPLLKTEQNPNSALKALCDEPCLPLTPPFLPVPPLPHVLWCSPQP